MKIKDSTFTIVGNGFADGPSQALRDYLNKHKAKRVITIAHPLVPEGDNSHILIEYKSGKKVREKKIKLPNKPPYTYTFDPFFPFKLPKDDIWFGFNNLACMRGLTRKKTGRTKKVVYWAVDFFPNRFGNGLATKAYDAVDKYVCKKVDLRVELSQAALEGRTKYAGLKKTAPGTVVPMGAWLDRTPKAKASAFSKKKLVYLGHLVERQGVKTAVKALAELIKNDPSISLEIVGSGPEIDNLKALAKKLKVEKNIKFHGFVKDHKDVEKILASGTLAVAPYVKDEKSFTQFADPGKLKAYLGASLPIVMTNVPPNSKELEEKGAAILIEDSPKALVSAINKLFSHKSTWQKHQTAAKNVALEFDWNILLEKALKELDITV